MIWLIVLMVILNVAMFAAYLGRIRHWKKMTRNVSPGNRLVHPVAAGDQASLIAYSTFFAHFIAGAWGKKVFTEPFETTTLVFMGIWLVIALHTSRTMREYNRRKA